MNVSLEDLKKKTASLYGLAIAAAGRANEIASGSQPLIHTKSKKVSTIVLEEFAKGKVHYEVPKPKSEKAS